MDNIKIEEGVIVIPQPPIPQPDERISIKELLAKIEMSERQVIEATQTKAKAMEIHDKRIAEAQKKVDELLAIKAEVVKIDPSALNDSEQFRN